MTAIQPGTWTIKVSGFEPSTFVLDLKPDGSVSGQRSVEDYSGTVTGTWHFTDPVLQLDLSSHIGLNPQPANYTIQLTDNGHGSDDQGHRFTLHKG